MGADAGHLFEEELQTLTDTINRINRGDSKRHQSVSIVLSDSMSRKRSLVDRFLQLFQ